MNEQDKTELLELLNVALYDADALMGQSHDHDEAAAYREHKAKLRTWRWGNHMTMTRQRRIESTRRSCARGFTD